MLKSFGDRRRTHGQLQRNDAALRARLLESERALSDACEVRTGSVAELVVLPSHLAAGAAQGSYHDRPPEEHRVLVVEHDPMMRSIVRRILVYLGYSVAEASGAVEALDALQADPFGFHAVVTEHSMPGMSGLGLARQLRELRPGLPVVLGIAPAEQVATDAAEEAGVSVTLPRPYAAKGLAEVLAALIAEAEQEP